MTHGQLFAGIGGFGLAAQWAGIENVWANEIDPYCCKILRQNFPNLKVYEEDIRLLEPERVDIISGGFPCQPFSNAGKRKGTKDDRYLWPEMLRIIGEIRPLWIVIENVAGLLSMENGKTLERILSDLEDQTYKTETYIIPAGACSAWHRRDRIWVAANIVDRTDTAIRREGGKKEEVQRINGEKGFARELVGTISEVYPYNGSKRIQGGRKKEIPELKGFQGGEDGGRYAIIGNRPDSLTPVLCRSYDGIPYGMDRIKALGNAIVPQVAYEIFKAIIEND